MVQVVLIGANGKMGQIAEFAISQMENFQIVAKVQRQDNLESILKKYQPEIAIDLTSHVSVLKNTEIILNQNVRPVIGSSGLSKEEMDKFKLICDQKKLGGLIIPNFSIAFCFINKVSKEFSKFYKDMSIVEFHHAQKKDKPSGTARYTAELVGISDDKISSVRSDGFLAKQQIYITSEDERILIDHESFSRKSFVKGIQLSLMAVLNLNKMIIGLENVDLI